MGIFDRINISKYRVVDFIELVIGGVSFVSAIVGVLTFLQGQSATVVIVAFVGLFALCVIFFIKIRKLADASLEGLRVLADTLKMCTEAVKKDAYYLEQAHLRRDLTQHELLLHVKATSRDFVDRIANALSTSADERVCVCVKVFSENYPRAPVVPELLDDYYLETLCRSNNSTGALARVGENTDFLSIMKEGWPFFRHRDLVQYEKQLKANGARPYRNSSLDWREHYRGTVVVPIAAEQRIFASGAEKEVDLLGFLCADSLSPSAFRVSHIEAYTNLMQAFATVLYPYFDRMYSYLQELDERSR
jgi:hypothetical protein